MLRARKEAATHICTEDKDMQALWHHMKDVFSQRVQQIQLFTFFFALFQKPSPDFMKMSFVPVAIVTGQRSGQRIGVGGRSGAEVTSEFLITGAVTYCA